MISFMDMTFCPFYLGCEKSATCGRAYTDRVKEAARRWWGGDDGAPVSLFAEHPNCFTPIK